MKNAHCEVKRNSLSPSNHSNKNIPTRHYSIFGWTKGVDYQKFPRVLKLWKITSEGLGRCLKVTLRTHAPKTSVHVNGDNGVSS